MNVSILQNYTYLEDQTKRAESQKHTYIFSLSFKPVHLLQNKIENKIHVLQNAFVLQNKFFTELIFFNRIEFFERGYKYLF